MTAPPPAAGLGGHAVGSSGPVWALLALLLGGGLALRLALVAANHAFTGAGLHLDEAQYWLWSLDLQWGYYSKPPVIAALIRASTTLFGDSVLGVKTLAMACYAGCGGLLFGVGRLLCTAPGVRPDAGADRVGLLAVGLFSASPLVGLLGLSASTDAPLLLCWAAVLALAWLACQRQQAWAWPVLALTLGVGLLSKYTLAALLPGLLWWAWRRGGWPQVLRMAAACAGGLVLLLPHLLWNADNGWPTLLHTAQGTLGESRAGGWQQLLRPAAFAATQALALGPVSWWLLWRAGRPRAPQAVEFLLATGLPLLLVGLAQSVHGRAEPNWIAPVQLNAALLVALAAARLSDGAARRGVVALAVQALLVSAVGLAPVLASAVQPGRYPPVWLDAWARLRGWDAVFAELQPNLAAVQWDGDGRPWLVSDSRNALAHAGYAWRELKPHLVGLQQGVAAHSHFELNCPLASAVARSTQFVLVTEGPPGPAMLNAFARALPLAQAAAPRSRGRAVEIQLTLVSQPQLAAVVGARCS